MKTTSNTETATMTRQIDRAIATARDARNELSEDRRWTGRSAGATRFYKRTARRASRRAARLSIASR